MESYHLHLISSRPVCSKLIGNVQLRKRDSGTLPTRAGRGNMSTIKAFRNIIFTFYRYGEIIDKTNATGTKLNTIGYISDFQPKNGSQVCCDKHYLNIFLGVYSKTKEFTQKFSHHLLTVITFQTH